LIGCVEYQEEVVLSAIDVELESGSDWPSELDELLEMQKRIATE
jgi:hypothetical protein